MNDIIERVARKVFGAMRFERKPGTPEWIRGGNSNAQERARKTAREIVADLDEWQPIETARKTKKGEPDIVIDLYWKNSGGTEFQITGFWCWQFKLWRGWPYVEIDQPTHWKPQSAPPKETHKGETL